MNEQQAEFRFYEELNDLLPKHRRKQTFTHRFSGCTAPGVLDTSLMASVILGVAL